MRNLKTKGLNAPRAMVMALFLLLTCFVAGRTAVTAEAASNKVTVLKQGKTYSSNLNGGKKKEKIRYTFNCPFNSRVGDFKLYVNGKKVYSSSIRGDDAVVTLLDLDSKDKYKELFVTSLYTYESSILGNVFLMRYVSGKKVKVYNCDYIAAHLGRLPSVLKNSGKNKFYVVSDTPFYNNTFGCNYGLIPLKLQGDRLVAANADAYDLVEVDYDSRLGAYKKYKKSKYKYTLSHSMTLYSSPSRSKPSGTLRSGTSFTASKIRPAGAKAVYSMTWYDVFVKVKTVSGRTGWLLFPADSDIKYLKYRPWWS